MIVVQRLARPAALALALALALAACTARVAVPPAPQAPAAWRAGTPGMLPHARGWWASFASPELVALQQEALARSSDLAAVLARVAQARAAARVAGAGRYPALDLTGGVSRSDRGSGRDFGTGGFGGGAFDFGGRSGAASTRYEAVLGARYELDLWGRQRALALGGGARAAARAEDLAAARISVRAEVALAYFRALALARREALAHERVADAQRRVALTEGRAAAGAIAQVELAAERAALARLQSAVPAIARDRAVQLHALAVLVGRVPAELTAPTAGFAALAVPAVAPDLPAAVLARRPDVRSARAELLGARADAAAARAALLPALSLTVQGGGSSSALGELLASEGRLWSLGLDVVAPLFDGGRLRAERDRAAALTEERVALYRTAVLTALREVEDALAVRTYAQALRAAQDDAYAAAAHSEQLARARYEAGALDQLAWLDARRQRDEAQDAQVTARLAQLEAAVGLYRALAGGYDGACIGPESPCMGREARLECAPPEPSRPPQAGDAQAPGHSSQRVRGGAVR